MAPRSRKMLSNLSNELLLEVASYLSGPDKVCFALTSLLHYDTVKHQMKAIRKPRLVDLCPRPKKDFLDLYGKTKFETLMRRLVVWMPTATLRNVLMNTSLGNRALRVLLEWPSKGYYTPHRNNMAVKMCKWQQKFDEDLRDAVKIAKAKERIAGCRTCTTCRMCRTCRDNGRKVLAYYDWKFSS